MIAALARLLTRPARPIGECSPWRRVVYASVGGLSEVGFAPDESAMLAISESGRGLFSLSTGELTARDDEPPSLDSAWLDPNQNSARGIGPLTNVWMPIVGLAAGELPQSSGEWRVEIRGTGREEIAVLLHGRSAGKWLVERPISTVRAFGFSRSGQFLALATSSSLTVFSSIAERPLPAEAV